MLKPEDFLEYGLSIFLIIVSILFSRNVYLSINKSRKEFKPIKNRDPYGYMDPQKIKATLKEKLLSITRSKIARRQARGRNGRFVRAVR